MEIDLLLQHEFEFFLFVDIFLQNCKVHFNHKARLWTTRFSKKLNHTYCKVWEQYFQNLFNQKNACDEIDLKLQNESLQLYEWEPLIENWKWTNIGLISVWVK